MITLSRKCLRPGAVGLVWVVACSVVLQSACAPGGGSAVGEPDQRPADGLLTDGDLQAVVDAQLLRDWESLAAYLVHDRPAVRARAAFALASVQAYQAVPALIALLKDSDGSVRRDAAFALGQSAQQEAADPILEALQSESDALARHRLIEALGKLGFDEVVDAVIGLEVTGSDQVDRLLALARLGAIQGKVTEASLNALLAELDADDPDARFVAAYFFGRAQQSRAWAPRVATVRAALDGYRAGDRAAIHLVKALAKLGDPADTERLAALAGGASDWRVRAEAMAALRGRPMDEAVRTVLMAGLNDASIHVSVNAATALAQGTHLPSELGRISAWVQGNPERWQAAAPLLINLARQDEQEFILQWLDGLPADDEVRRDMGLRALGQMRGDEALSRLEGALNGDSQLVAGAAAAGLRQRWATDKADPRTHQRYFGIASEAVSSRRSQTVSAAAPVLSDPLFVSRGSLPVLLSAMNAASVPEELETVTTIVGTLGQTGDPSVVDVLRDALDHPYQDVRATAARALGQHFGEEVEAPEGGLPTPGDAVEAGVDPSVIDWAYLATLGSGPRLILETESGTMVVEMRTEEAPHTVQTLARLAQAGRFDGIPFHRVVPNFVVQGGDVARQNGRGGAGFAITTEITQIPYVRGVIGMASAGKDTESSQFFLVHSAQPHLDGGYTAFGWLVEGGEALDAVGRGESLLTARLEPGH